MTQQEFVDQILCCAKDNWKVYWDRIPDEARLRLSGIEQKMREIFSQLMQGFWEIMSSYLDELSRQEVGRCQCGKKREARKKKVKIDLLGIKTEFLCNYFYCRHCHKGYSPVRKWLGKESGGVSLSFERALTDLTTRLTFGTAVDSMQQQQGHEVDRTKAERITYNVGRDAEIYLKERRKQAISKLATEQKTYGVAELVFTADGGIIPIGTMKRPKKEEITSTTPLTKIRKIPKGKRDMVGREARLIIAHKPETKTERTVDCHIAPYQQTEVTGERMLAVAAQSGLRDNTHIHGVFDMGKWIHRQFEEQFFEYKHSACADIIHVTEYLIEAGRNIVGKKEAVSWGFKQKKKLLAGNVDDVIDELEKHKCSVQCLKNDDGKCLAQVAKGYIKNNRQYLDYLEILIREFPIGSGEAESGIRHIVKRRASVAGAWKEENANLIFALISIRASGWWDDFWFWREKRDIKNWQNRQKNYKPLFRNKRKRAA